MLKEKQKYFYLYQITNLLNNKIYIGVHETYNLDDNYMGSGTLLHEAYTKYGIENFKKEIIEYFDSKESMYAKEAEIVNDDFLNRTDVYNINYGGYGSWSKNAIEASRSPEVLLKKKEIFQKNGHQKGTKNSQYGKHWITNGIDNRSIKENETIPEGWRLGRCLGKNSKMSQYYKDNIIKWVNDGTKDYMMNLSDGLPEGFNFGRLHVKYKKMSVKPIKKSKWQFDETTIEGKLERKYINIKSSTLSKLGFNFDNKDMKEEIDNLKQKLIRLYKEQEMSCKEIGINYGIKDDLVKKLLLLLEIPIRTASEASILAFKKGRKLGFSGHHKVN